MPATAPACWPATLLPRWGAPGEDLACRSAAGGQARRRGLTHDYFCQPHRRTRCPVSEHGTVPSATVPSGTSPSGTVPDGTVSSGTLFEATNQDGAVQYVSIGSLELEAGGFLPDVTLAYETWGTLNEDGSNAILVQHALTGSTHVTRGAGDEEGWWEQLAGPGAPADTDRFFVISINILGGCYGSTGPSSAAPDGKPWGSRFPLVTLGTPPLPRRRLADRLGISSWYAVVGGSMGGARALEWAVTYPERVRRCGVISVGAEQHRRTDRVRPGADARHPAGPPLQRRRLLRRPGTRGGPGARPPDCPHHLPFRL